MLFILQIILIFLNTLFSALNVEGAVVEYIQLLGSPIIAIALGLILAVYTLTIDLSNSEGGHRMEEGIKDSGAIILVVGGGGGLGQGVTASGAGALRSCICAYR